MDTPTNTPTTPDVIADGTVTAAIIDIVKRARAITDDYACAIDAEYGMGDSFPETLAAIVDMADALAGHYGIGDADPNGDRYAVDAAARGYYARNSASNPRDDAADIVHQLRTLADALVETGIGIRCEIKKAELPALAEVVDAE